MRIYFIILLSLILGSCKKEKGTVVAPINSHPFAGEYKIKSIGSSQYLKYFEGTSLGVVISAVDIYSGVATSFKFIASDKPGAYFITTTHNRDKFIDLNNSGYTYLTTHNFTNSISQLFTLEPIYKDADRYYIRSYADSTKYLVSKYSNYGMATTTALYPLNLIQWDCIWALEK